MFTIYITGLFDSMDCWEYVCNNYTPISAKNNGETWILKFKIK